MKCYRCGEPGHLVADCPHAPPSTTIIQKTPDQPVPCFVCGQLGHFAIACRLHPSRMRSIRDTACGAGPCTTSCRLGDHMDCAFSWCECICHTMLQALIQQ